ncbi:hypothetical protein [Legionella septentrionalis]|uniref:hypothetical protein n=1 Tax=Legionella septentrionalis TaxID=2498109 RepID=UPI000F8D6527|nr:hypothetical protein [Legionella septentrionalis]RUQ96343.1 hypothetical protein ELY11_08165 [Legionella septentrionalis]
MPNNDKSTQYAQPQAIFMQYLLEKAKAQIANKKPEELAFDPQGRVLIDVPLQKFADFQPVVKSINDATGMRLRPVQKELEEALDRKITHPVTVSLDFSGDKELQKKFNARLQAAGIEKQPEGAKGSMIPLQQEFHFHLSLAARVYQDVIQKKSGEEAFEHLGNNISKAKEAALLRVNELVLQAYARALEKGTKDGVVDLGKVNQELDKARKEIAPQAHQILMQEIIKNTGVVLNKEDFAGAKHLAEKTAATANDVLHVDARLGIVTWIGASEGTAHERGAEKYADRQLITQKYSNGQVKASNERIQIRTPSLDIKKRNVDDKGQKESYQDFVERAEKDIQTKLGTLAKKYHFENLSGGGDNDKPKAFVYNLYTSLNDTLGDVRGNLQSQGAEIILKGAHHYNLEQLQKEPSVFCFVQNIPVNGFGSSLGYGSGNALQEEATLMAEMAMLHTLYKNEESIRKVMALYEQYLHSEPRKPYFSQSEEGKQAIIAIQAIKEQWKQPTQTADAQECLKRMMANDLHFEHDYSKTMQALSVFLEAASIGGCKSGNERAQAINGRVAMLDAKFDELSAPIKAIAQANSSEIKQKANEFKSSLDSIYNREGLQGAMSVVSLIDQGGPAKVEAKSNLSGVFKEFQSRNSAEESADTMTNLHQSKASKMQAHKGLTDYMQKAWEGNPSSTLDRMKNTLGKVGMILGILTVVPLLIFAIVTPILNANKASETKIANEQLLKESKALVLKDAHATLEQVITENKKQSFDQLIDSVPGNGKFSHNSTNSFEDWFKEAGIEDRVKENKLPVEAQENLAAVADVTVNTVPLVEEESLGFDDLLENDHETSSQEVNNNSGVAGNGANGRPNAWPKQEPWQSSPLNNGVSLRETNVQSIQSKVEEIKKEPQVEEFNTKPPVKSKDSAWRKQEPWQSSTLNNGGSQKETKVESIKSKVEGIKNEVQMTRAEKEAKESAFDDDFWNAPNSGTLPPRQ